MLRGINRQEIFHDGEDYDRFLQTLARFKNVCGYVLLGYCLMPNHVHLLVREGNEGLSTVFRRIGASYVYWYNGKYNRVGHLFQDRFRSEAVENDEYLLTVLRYIHQNPLKAGLCERLGDYPYSSYAAYIGEGGIVDTALILDMVGRDGFIEYHKQDGKEPCLEDRGAAKPRLTDQKVLEALRHTPGCDGPSGFLSLDRQKQRAVILALLEQGASIRQISRLTGVSFGSVRWIAVNK